MSKVTENDLNFNEWISNETKTFFSRNSDFVNKEIRDLCKSQAIPARVAGNLLFEIVIDKEEKILLEEAADILNSNYIYRSSFIHNSNYVQESFIVEDSEKITFSNNVYDSKNVSHSMMVEQSENVFDSKYIVQSKNVYKSNGLNNCMNIAYQQRGDNNCYVFGGKEIENCSFCSFHEDSVAYNCILSNENIGQYTILNHNVAEKDYNRFKKNFEKIIRHFSNINYDDEAIKHLNKVNFFNNYSQPALWMNIIQMLPFEVTKDDIMLAYRITFLPDFLRMKI